MSSGSRSRRGGAGDRSIEPPPTGADSGPDDGAGAGARIEHERDEPALSLTPRQLGGMAVAALLVVAIVRLLRGSRADRPGRGGDAGADDAGA